MLKLKLDNEMYPALLLKATLMVLRAVQTPVNATKPQRHATEQK